MICWLNTQQEVTPFSISTRTGTDPESGRASGLFASLVQNDALSQTVDLLEHQGRAVLFTDLVSYRIRGTRGRSPMTAGHFLPLDEIVELFREFRLISEDQPSEAAFALASVRARLPDLENTDARQLSELMRSLAPMVIATYRERRSQTDVMHALLGTEDRAEIAERAAIQEFDGGLSRDEAERAALASHVRRPH